MSKKSATTKATQKDAAASEKLRKEAIAEIDKRLEPKHQERDTTTLAEFFPAPNPRKGGKMTRVSVPVADGANPPTKTKKAKPAKGKAAKPAKSSKRDGKISGLDAAAKVLAASKEPLNAVTIAERAIAAGWKTNGKTPHATLYAAMIREIQAKGKAARFVKKDRGLFTAAKGS